MYWRVTISHTGQQKLATAQIDITVVRFAAGHSAADLQLTEHGNDVYFDFRSYVGAKKKKK